MINGNVPSFKELLSISKKAYLVDAFFSDSIYYKIIARYVKWGFFVLAIWAELQRAQNFPMHCPPARVPITREVSYTYFSHAPTPITTFAIVESFLIIGANHNVVNK